VAAVSVIMPCFNAGETVDEAIASILAGTWEDLELIAIDDGSSDDTAMRLQAWEARDARVRPLLRQHEGLIGALNAGWQHAAGDLLARMDADDLSYPSRLAKQVELLQQRGEIAAVGTLVRSFPEQAVREGFRRYVDWLNSLVTPEEIARDIYVESPMPHPSVMIRRTWLERMGGYQDRGWPEDYDLWLRMHLAGARFAKVPEVLLDWREHENRATRTDSRYSVENFLRAKAHYLMRGPLRERDAVIIWGAGQMGARLSKHLLREGAPIAAFLDVDPQRIGRKKRGVPVESVDELSLWRSRYERPALLMAVRSARVRDEMRTYLPTQGLQEGEDWWVVA
jgi:glycosyltransferase involved in cell wall biosynthesis